MKQFNAAHLEIKKSFTEYFETHPYEVGWADEVIFFVYIEDVVGSGTFDAKVQISHDGIHWADEGTAFKTILIPSSNLVLSQIIFIVHNSFQKTKRKKNII